MSEPASKPGREQLGLLDRLLAFVAFGPDVFWRRP